jgi:mannosyltransferase OCH1-like enzyme
LIRIPKVFHRIWLGGKPMPKEFCDWGESWLDLHPGWSMRLWTERDLYTSHPQLLPKCAHVSMQTDVYRFEIGLREGGIYLDTDFECLKNIEPLIDGLDCFSAYQEDEVGHPHAVACGFFGTVPGHPIFKDLVDGLPNADIDDPYGLGPPYFTKMVLNRPEMRLFDRSLFYPYSWREPYRRGESFPRAFAVHHWAGKWFPDSFKPLEAWT